MARSPFLPFAAVLAWITLGFVGIGPALAQDLEPRAYANTPVGMHFLIAGYAYTTGNVATDPALPIEDAEVDIHTGLLAYAHSFGVLGKSAKVDVIVPYARLDGTAEFMGTPEERVVDGLVDPRVRLSVNLFGAPAMKFDEWLAYRQNIIIGSSLQVTVPVGQYHSDKLVNLGTNRWKLKPEIGISKSWGPVILELTGAAAFHTDNHDFRDQTREQDPILSTQGHLLYTFWGAAWASFDVTYYAGGQTTVDGVRNDDRQSNVRVGATLTLPVSLHNSVKFFGSTAASTRTGTEFDTFGVAWQYRWGGGMHLPERDDAGS